MSAVLDIAAMERVPLTRLVEVELRKLFDTRAGRWRPLSISTPCLPSACLLTRSMPSQPSSAFVPR